MDATAELGRNQSTRFSLSMEMSRLTRDGTAEPVSRDQILRHEHERGRGNIHFSCSADHVQDWQPSYPADPYSWCTCDHTYIHHGNNPLLKSMYQVQYYLELLRGKLSA